MYIMKPDQPKIRKKAIFKVLLGTVGCSMVFGFVLLLAYGGHQMHLPMILILVPFTYSCAGLVELITGTQFKQLGDRWASLPRWQQRCLGTLLILLGTVIVVYLVWLLFRLLT